MKWRYRVVLAVGPNPGVQPDEPAHGTQRRGLPVSGIDSRLLQFDSQALKRTNSGIIRPYLTRNDRS
jgi:hypothetical protein